MPTVLIEDVSFSRMVRALARASAVTPIAVLESEAAKVLEGALRVTKAADPKKIQEQVARRVERKVVREHSKKTDAKPEGRWQLKFASRTRKWWIFDSDRNIWYLCNGDRVLPDEVWQKFHSMSGERDENKNTQGLQSDELKELIREAVTKEVARKLQHRGLAKQSWWMAARELGYNAEAPAFVKKATAGSASLGDDISIQRGESEATGYTVTIINRSPVTAHEKAGGHYALQTAIRNRVRYFEKNLEKGVFDKISKIARAYPGIGVS